MKKERLILGIVLFILGFFGVLSILTMNIPLPEEISKVLLEQFSLEQIKLLALINPTIMLIGSILLGMFMYDKVSLTVPIINGIIKKNINYQVSSILKYGIIGGVFSGIILTLVGVIYYPFLPLEFIELGDTLKPTLIARFLYGGLTEEILMRFGLMTFIIWLLSKIFKRLNSKIYWVGILITAILFALGHFPIAFQSVSNPSGVLLSYILIGNTIGGVIFGWLYWKKGLEAAFIAHICTHIIMILGEPLMNTV
jgi:membrane protease YdiL (CAAX protease family)